MPSLRKRIGFLPRAEVQIIIDQICKNNKLSQSKVTGILVEEALISRGMLEGSLNNQLIEMNCNNYKSLLITNSSVHNVTLSDNENRNFNEHNIDEEVKMINDYIEFKFFKDIMNKRKKNI